MTQSKKEKIVANGGAGQQHRDPEEIFKKIGEFGPYQLRLFMLISITSFVCAMISYGYPLYASTPQHRCKLPGVENDTYEIWSEEHRELVNLYIPYDQKLQSYHKCEIRTFPSESDRDEYIRSNGTKQGSSELEKCKEFVYSKVYFEKTLSSYWNMVCDKAPERSAISTLFFIGSYGVFLSGLVSDKYGRKFAIYSFLTVNAFLHILIALLFNTNLFSSTTQKTIFLIVRTLTGTTAAVYGPATVLAIELCGPSKRLTAVNSIYYLYIVGEFITVFFAYFLRSFDQFLIAQAAFFVIYLLYFWVIPESPRWLMTKDRYPDACVVFKKIARSNKRSAEFLNDDQELEAVDDDKLNNTNENNTLKNPEQVKASQESFFGTLKIFFMSKKIIILSLVILINWITNTLVYYGISFNTSELAGDPYLNFTLSGLVEMAAIFACQMTLDRFGRRIPYAVNMITAGSALLMIMFVPLSMPYLTTVLALIAKFSISFTFNGIYAITAELYPTVIRSSSLAICQTISRFGAVISPNVQLLGTIVWGPLPFIIYGATATFAAVLFIFVMPETKSRKLPETIEQFIDEL